MSSNRDKAINLLFREVTPATGDPAEDLVLRLREIRNAKDDVLTDDEYEAFRQGVIKQVVSRAYVPGPFVAALAILCLGSLALVAWGLSTGANGGAIGGTAGAAMCVLLWRGLARDYVAKRALPRSRRLAIVERLLREDLITDREAKEYSEQIDALFPTETA